MRQYGYSEQFPVLLPRDARFDAAREIAGAYDSIYTGRSDVWEDQGRTPELIRYFATLLVEFSPRRILEVGCGEGALLAAVQADEKFGTDLSAQALGRVSPKRTHDCRLPSASGCRFPTSIST